MPKHGSRPKSSRRPLQKNGKSINQCWSMDFMYEQLAESRCYRLFKVIDDFNREALAININLSLPSERVIQALDQIIAWRGKPQVICSDNGPKCISGAFIAWTKHRGIQLDHIQPGNPQQYTYIERYNHKRSNMSLGDITPKQKSVLLTHSISD